MFGVVTHCGVQVCSDDKCLGLLHIVRCNCVPMTSVWVVAHCAMQLCSDDKCLGLLHIVGCKCVQMTNVWVCYTLWGASE